MTHIPDLWWSPSKGLFHRPPGDRFYTTVMHDDETNVAPRNVRRGPLPKDAVRLGEEISDYIRVGEMVSTKDRSDSYWLASGPQAMYLEPIDFGEGHIIELAEEGWTIKHPLSCRPNLFACEFNAAARASEPTGLLGRFRCRVDGEGLLVIDEEGS